MRKPGFHITTLLTADLCLQPDLLECELKVVHQVIQDTCLSHQQQASHCFSASHIHYRGGYNRRVEGSISESMAWVGCIAIEYQICMPWMSSWNSMRYRLPTPIPMPIPMPKDGYAAPLQSDYCRHHKLNKTCHHHNDNSCQPITSEKIKTILAYAVGFG